MVVATRRNAFAMLAAVVVAASIAGCAPGAQQEMSADAAVTTTGTSPQGSTEPTLSATEAAPLVMEASAPRRVRLPALGVETDLMELGLDHDGSLEVPPTAYPAGWYTGAPTPGALGPAIIAGHVDYKGEVGVFHDLHRLAVGDEVRVDRADGSTAVFLVTVVDQYAKDSFPTDAVYGDIDHAGLRLITCGGDFDWDARSHVDNVVVFAELASVVDAGA